MTEKHSHTYNRKPPPVTAQGGFGFIPNGIREKNIFFYHPDHLGSSSYITGQDGKVSQHTEYIAFGEILFDEHNTEHTMPYLFNGKELDSETGLYYYGARYYDPKVSIFVNVDPLVEKTMQSYAYANNNPVMLIDPTGMEGESSDSTGVKQNKDGSYTVVSAKNDGDNGIYLVDKNGNYNINSSKKIGKTMTPYDFMKTNDSNGSFDGHINITFKLTDLTVSGKVKLNKYTEASIRNANAQELLDWGQLLYNNEVKRLAPSTFYGKLEILREMSANGAPLDFKKSLGLNPYTAIKAGTSQDKLPIITTLRAMGNMVFGANMKSTKPAFLGTKWYYNQVMQKVGEYNQRQNNGNGYNSGHPFYGEHTYSGSYIYYGYFGKFYK